MSVLAGAGRSWLWRGTGALKERRRKAAAVIEAVARVLESRRPIGAAGQRTVAALRQFEEYSPRTRSWLLGEPYAYFWGRLAYELLRAVLQPDAPAGDLARHYCSALRLDPRQALLRHAPDFARLNLGAAMLDGIDLELESPLTVDAPFALPGTALGIDGTGRTGIRGIIGGRIRTGGTVTTCPTLALGGCEWRLQPAVFNVPVSGVPDEAWQAGCDFQAAHAARVEGALAILRGLGGGMFTQLREGLRIVATRPEGRAGDLTNVSHCDLPGAASVSPSPYPYELANTIWHEYLHNRLFALEEKGLFLAPPPAGADARMYSPWRSDQRPAHGLLHAVYVFTGVGRYWSRVAQSTSTPQTVRELARTRILRGLCQVRLGLALLRRHARFTPRGDELMDSLQREHNALWRAAPGIEPDTDLPHTTFRPGTAFGIERHDETVRERVTSHLHRHGTADDAGYLEPLLHSHAPAAMK